jgi:hypothetical protein
MPGLGATDPANLEAQACAELGFSRQLEQPRRVVPPPRLGGSSGYPVWYREQQLQRFNAGEAIDVSWPSICRWADRLEPFRQTGNTERTTIVGVDLLSLVTYITAWLDATLDEMAVFIYNKGGDLYSRDAISKCLSELDIAKKRASTEGYQTQHPDVHFRVWGFWNCPPPLAFFRCHEGCSLTWMSLGQRLRDATARGDWP